MVPKIDELATVLRDKTAPTRGKGDEMRLHLTRHHFIVAIGTLGAPPTKARH